MGKEAAASCLDIILKVMVLNNVPKSPSPKSISLYYMFPGLLALYSLS